MAKSKQLKKQNLQDYSFSANNEINTNVLNIIGENIRRYRVLLNLPQKSLAEALGITFQQVQKYERGLSEISAFKLYKLAKFFNKSVDSFFTLSPISLEVVQKPSISVAEDVKLINFNDSKSNITSPSTVKIIEFLQNKQNLEELEKLIQILKNNE